MARDIEEFLRKAAERRRQQQAEKQGGAAGKKPASPQPTRQPPRQPPRREPQANIVEAVEAVDDEIIEAQPVQRSSSRRRSVQSGVESHIDTSKIASHADQIGSLKVQKSGDVDKVKQKFDRGARKFETRHTTRDNTDDEIVGQDVSAVATDLIQMLRDPKSIRQAILVSEILRRPDFDD